MVDGLEALVKQSQARAQAKAAVSGRKPPPPSAAAAVEGEGEEAAGGAIPRFASWAAAHAYVDAWEKGEYERRAAKMGVAVGSASDAVAGAVAAAAVMGQEDDDDSSTASSSSSSSSSGSYSDDEEGEESTLASASVRMDEEEGEGPEGMEEEEEEEGVRGRWAPREKTEEDLEAEAAFEKAFAGMVTASVEERQAAARAGGGGLLALSADKMVLPSTLPQIVRRVRALGVLVWWGWGWWWLGEGGGSLCLCGWMTHSTPFVLSFSLVCLCMLYRIKRAALAGAATTAAAAV